MQPRGEPGPFRADQLREGDRYELSHGHAVRVPPRGATRAAAVLAGADVIATDPAVERAGVDAGFSPARDTLRAPDVSILPAITAPGWIPSAPPLAVEYADVGQDEEKLVEKIADLLEHGTEHIWVVRLGNVPYVEVHRPGQPVVRVDSGDVLTAPGILQNPVPAEALWNRDASDRATLRNLLNRVGYRDLDEVRAEGREEGRDEGREEGRCAELREVIRALAHTGGVPLTAEENAAIERMSDVGALRSRLDDLATRIVRR